MKLFECIKSTLKSTLLPLVALSLSDATEAEYIQSLDDGHLFIHYFYDKTGEQALSHCHEVIKSYPFHIGGRKSNNGSCVVVPGMIQVTGLALGDKNENGAYILHYLYFRFDQYCNAPYLYSFLANACQARCQIGQAWDNTKKTCIDPPKEQSCKSLSANPIDFIDGEKLRLEPVISTGGQSNITLTYYYNNQKNREKAASATVPSAESAGEDSFNYSNTYVADTIPPISANEYKTTYNDYGVPKNAPDVLPSQHYGALEQYWRHNFDEVLQIKGSNYILHLPKGQSIGFSGLGYNNIYPYFKLERMLIGEEAFAGYTLINTKTGEIKKFDDVGRLRIIERSKTDVLTLSYDTQNRLQRITHNDGSYLELAYERKPTNSIYSLNISEQDYPIKITSSTSEVVNLKWGHTYSGQTAKFYMLTQKTAPSIESATATREYEYNDPRWPASITDIYDVSSTPKSTRTLYTHFDYDDKGRAINSELANGFERVQVNYVADNQRVVTNALGKNATYNFADFNGVTRLHNVVGEATNSCAESNTTYGYYPNGNLEKKTTNGVVTHYQYNTKNQKTLETVAQGTPVARTTKTCWHPTLNKPERIIEPGSVTQFEYFDSGQLKSKKVEPRSSANESCQ